MRRFSVRGKEIKIDCLPSVRGFTETMIQEGTDRYGSVHNPMFASLLDMETHRIPEDMPANIEGQRYSDRSLRGGNLQHDVMLLQACDLLTQLSGEASYRHAGFYIKLWSFLYSKTDDRKYADWILKMIGHHWIARDSKTGILPATTRGGQAQIASVESTLSLAVSLLESAAELPPGDAKERCQKAGREYAEAVLRLPHRPLEGKFLASFQMKTEPAQTLDFGEPCRYGYGGGFSSDNASLLLALFRLTSNQHAFELAGQFADYYSRHDPPPPYEIVRAHVYASVIGLFADLYSLRKSLEHLRQAERYARLAVERLFYRGLFRGATSIDHYEGDLMVGNLAYNLLWLHALQQNPGLRVPPNYFNR